MLRLKENEALLPEGLVMENIGEALGMFSSNYNLLCDWRGLHEVTEDVVDLVGWLCSHHGAKVIATPEEASFIQEYFRNAPHILRVKNDSHKLNYTPVDLEPFDDDIDIDNLSEPESLADIDTSRADLKKFRQMHYESYSYGGDFPDEEYEDNEEIYREPIHYLEDELEDEIDDLSEKDVKAEISLYDLMLGYRVDYLTDLFQWEGRNSLLNEFVIQENASSILVAPYHTHAHYPLELKNQLLVSRPGVIARKTGVLLEPEIAGLQHILNARGVKEAQIQSYLEKNPNILKVLGGGYAHIYPQVVLHREDGTSLRPDFILRPVGDDWCDILDIKLPNKPVIVGGRDRKKFSSAVEELVAQLREYSAYFENEKLSKRIEDVYGIKCYRPRMIGVIGRGAYPFEDRQLRRLETIYADVGIITFDRLIEIAKTRLLI